MMNISILETMRRWANNSVNPKNVQVSFFAFVGMWKFFEQMDTSQLSPDDLKAFQLIKGEIDKKLESVRNRQAYAAVVQATNPEEKQAAYDSYQRTKQIKGRGY